MNIYSCGRCGHPCDHYDFCPATKPRASLDEVCELATQMQAADALRNPTVDRLVKAAQACLGQPLAIGDEERLREALKPFEGK